MIYPYRQIIFYWRAHRGSPDFTKELLLLLAITLLFATGIQ